MGSLVNLILLIYVYMTFNNKRSCLNEFRARKFSIELSNEIKDVI